MESTLLGEISAYLSDKNRVVFTDITLEGARKYALSICASAFEHADTETSIFNGTFSGANGYIQIPDNKTLVKLLRVEDSTGKCLTPLKVANSYYLNTGVTSSVEGVSIPYTQDDNILMFGCGGGSDVYKIVALVTDESAELTPTKEKEIFSKHMHIIVEFMLSYLLGMELESQASRSESEMHFRRGMEFLKMVKLLEEKASKDLNPKYNVARTYEQPQ